MSDETILANQEHAIRKFVKGYNKNVILNSVTVNSLGIIGHSLETIGNNLSTIVAAFEEMRASSNTTARNTERIDLMMGSIVENNSRTGEGIVERIGEINRASQGAVRLASLFADLAQKAEAIEQVTGSIQDVSDRTNILAINASIEAARAGTVGKGFRIIANEVRTLAGQTGDFAQTIESTISEFQSTVKEITGELAGFTALISKSRASFESIGDSYRENAQAIGEAGSFLSEINSSFREESEALNGGLSSLEGISSSLSDTRVVFGALLKTYDTLDHLLDREQ